MLESPKALQAHRFLYNTALGVDRVVDAIHTTARSGSAVRSARTAPRVVGNSAMG
jgi:hypothetical protein